MQDLSFGDREDTSDDDIKTIRKADYFREQLEKIDFQGLESSRVSGYKVEASNKNVLLFGFPGEMDCTKTMRRPGMENGPSQFHKILKYSLLVSIDDQKTSYIDCFGYMGSECHSYNEESYKARYASLT